MRRRFDAIGDLHAAGGNFGLADMDQAIQEGAGGEHDLARRKSLRRRAVRTPVTIPSFKIRSSALADANFQIGDVAQHGLHCCAVKRAVGLGARPAHRRTLAPVEQAKLDARRIRDAAHQAVQRIDLAHQMALADAADGGIAGHLAQGFEGVGEQQGAGAKARRCRRRFAAGMTAADDDDVVASWRLNTRRRISSTSANGLAQAAHRQAARPKWLSFMS